MQVDTINEKHLSNSYTVHDVNRFQSEFGDKPLVVNKSSLKGVQSNHDKFIAHNSRKFMRHLLWSSEPDFFSNSQLVEAKNSLYIEDVVRRVRRQRIKMLEEAEKNRVVEKEDIQ